MTCGHKQVLEDHAIFGILALARMEMEPFNKGVTRSGFPGNELTGSSGDHELEHGDQLGAPCKLRGWW